MFFSAVIQTMGLCKAYRDNLYCNRHHKNKTETQLNCDLYILAMTLKLPVEPAEACFLLEQLFVEHFAGYSKHNSNLSYKAKGLSGNCIKYDLM